MTAPTDTRGDESAPQASVAPSRALSADDLRAPITLPEVGTGIRTGRRRVSPSRSPAPAPSAPAASAPATSAPAPAAGAPSREALRREEPTPPARIAPPPIVPAPERWTGPSKPGSGPLALLLLIVAVGVLVVAVVAMGWAILDRLSDSVSGGGPPPGGPDVVVEDARGRAVLIHRVDDEIVGVTVVALGRGDVGGAAVFVPPGALLDVPGGEPDRLDAIEGDATIELAVENLIGASVGLVVSLDGTAWSEQLPPTFVFDNPAPVERAVDGGAVELLYPAGPVDLTPAEVPFLLAARSGGETDLDRLVRQQRLWEAWVDAVAAADRPVAGEPTSDLDTFMSALARGPIDYRLLPVDLLDRSDQLYVVDAADAPVILAALAPERLAAGDGDRVQLLNGVGRPGLATDVAAMLVPEGLSVPLTDNADQFGYRRTQIVYYRPEAAATASSVRELLGVGEVVESRTVLDAVDVTVVIGEDLADRIGVDDLTALASGGGAEQANQEN